MIQFRCQCGTQLQVQDAYAGKKAKCPTCQTMLTVPAVAAEAIQNAAQSPVPPAPTHHIQAEAGGPPQVLREAEGPRRRSPRDDDDYREPRARREAEPASGKALASLILGIGTFCIGLAGIPGLILGILALKDVKSKGYGGRGMAVAGIILSSVGMVLMIPATIFLWFAWQRVGEASNRALNTNNLKQISLAMHAYHDSYKRLPSQAMQTKDGKPGLSWRVAILPYIEQNNLYQQFHLDEPWDSPHNITLIKSMPPTYVTAGRPAPEPHLTYFQVFTGPNTPFRTPFEKLSLGGGFPDGTSNTLFIVEAGDAVPWTKPQDIEIKQGAPLPKLGGSQRHGFIGAMADGSVRFFDQRRVSERTLLMAIDPRDGNVLPFDWDDF